MKHLIGPAAKFGGALFALAIFVIMISLSYGALGRIFPGDLFNQGAGLVLFDISCVCWFLMFVGNSRSVGQYIIAGAGFVLGLLGTLAIIAIEVGISSGMLIAENMAKPLTYAFVIAAFGHLVLTYLFHVADPGVNSEITMGVQKAKAFDEGIRQAELAISRDLPLLGEVIKTRQIEELYRSMNMPREIIDVYALPMHDSLHVPSNGYPTSEKSPSFLADPLGWWNRRSQRNQSGSRTYEQAPPSPGTADDLVIPDLTPQQQAAMSEAVRTGKMTPEQAQRLTGQEPTPGKQYSGSMRPYENDAQSGPTTYHYHPVPVAEDQFWTCVCGERNGVHTNRCVVCKTQRRDYGSKEEAPESERPFRGSPSE